MTAQAALHSRSYSLLPALPFCQPRRSYRPDSHSSAGWTCRSCWLQQPPPRRCSRFRSKIASAAFRSDSRAVRNSKDCTISCLGLAKHPSLHATEVTRSLPAHNEHTRRDVVACSSMRALHYLSDLLQLFLQTSQRARDRFHSKHRRSRILHRYAIPTRGQKTADQVGCLPRIKPRFQQILTQACQICFGKSLDLHKVLFSSERSKPGAHLSRRHCRIRREFEPSSSECE